MASTSLHMALVNRNSSASLARRPTPKSSRPATNWIRPLSIDWVHSFRSVSLTYGLQPVRTHLLLPHQPPPPPLHSPHHLRVRLHRAHRLLRFPVPAPAQAQVVQSMPTTPIKHPPVHRPAHYHHRHRLVPPKVNCQPTGNIIRLPLPKKHKQITTSSTTSNTTTNSKTEVATFSVNSMHRKKHGHTS